MLAATLTAASSLSAAFVLNGVQGDDDEAHAAIPPW